MNEETTQVTLGEVWRAHLSIRSSLEEMRQDMSKIKTTLAQQSVKVGVVWTAFGMSLAAIVTAAISR